MWSARIEFPSLARFQADDETEDPRFFMEQIIFQGVGQARRRRPFAESSLVFIPTSKKSFLLFTLVLTIDQSTEKTKFKKLPKVISQKKGINKSAV